MMGKNFTYLLQGVKNVAEAAEQDQHIVLVSSALVTPKNRSAHVHTSVPRCRALCKVPIPPIQSVLSHMWCRFSPIRVILNNVKWSLMDNKYKGNLGWNLG